jgi:hypothetical protein
MLGLTGVGLQQNLCLPEDFLCPVFSGISTAEQILKVGIQLSLLYLSKLFPCELWQKKQPSVLSKQGLLQQLNINFHVVPMELPYAMLPEAASLSLVLGMHFMSWSPHRLLESIQLNAKSS